MTATTPTLVIGSKEGSSWSLRPWLLLKQTGIGFEEILITLRTPDTAAQIARFSPSGAVPVLHHKGRIIWDSMAIAEYVNEQWPGRGIWPADEEARAHARCAAAEDEEMLVHESDLCFSLSLYERMLICKHKI